MTKFSVLFLVKVIYGNILAHFIRQIVRVGNPRNEPLSFI